MCMKYMIATLFCETFKFTIYLKFSNSMCIQAHAQFLFHDGLWIIQVIKQLQKVLESEYHAAKDTDPFVKVLGI